MSTPSSIHQNGVAIPLTDWYRGPNVQQYAVEALARGHMHGDGPFGTRSERYLTQCHNSVAAFLTSSCTSALELAAQALSIGPGDEVLIPSYTFVSCATAFTSYGARPVFCDVDANTLNIRPDEIQRKMTDKTRAVVIVHYAGISADMSAISAICSGRNVPIVEDNAHGLFGRYKGRLLGTFGALTTLSFDQQKNYSCGEGGALLVNSRAVYPLVETAINCGTNRAAFERGEQREYVWIGNGSKRRPSELQGAILWSQLECRDAIQEGRGRVWNYYLRELRQWAERSQVRLPVVTDGCEPSYHLFYLVMPSTKARDALIAQLRSHHIGSAFHYLPLHCSPMGARFGPSDCPVAESAAARLVRLPCYPHLTIQQLDRIVDVVVHFELLR